MFPGRSASAPAASGGGMMRHRGYLVLASFVALASLCALVLPLTAGHNEILVKDENPIQEADAAKGGVLWVLDFKFKAPRPIVADVPGRGRRVCWYMWYQVINRTGAP